MPVGSNSTQRPPGSTCGQRCVRSPAFSSSDVNARGGEPLADPTAGLSGVTAIAGDVTIGDVVVSHKNVVIEAGQTPAFEAIDTDQADSAKLDAGPTLARVERQFRYYGAIAQLSPGADLSAGAVLSAGALLCAGAVMCAS